MKERIRIGLMGLGVVGSEIERALREKAGAIAKEVGSPLEVKWILVRDLSKERCFEVKPELLTTDAGQILGDPEVAIVIEVIGGESPSYEYIREAISNHKHVVTANKEVIAKHCFELLNLAAEYKVDLRYEASVGGGIPIISPLKQDLLANRILAIHAIINGTTNYILNKMAQEGIHFAAALKEAQELGYAEPNPSNDIEGLDAACKLAILATLAFHTEVYPEDIYTEGISCLSPLDFQYAKELGYEIKLLAIAKREGDSLQVRVHPVFIPEDLLLAKVEGVFNAVQVDGDLVGRVIFYGEGAGALPTSSAIIADVISLAQNINLGLNRFLRVQPRLAMIKKTISEIETKYYLRMSVVDQAGVLAQISKILGDHQISIASVIQKRADKRNQTAEIVLMSHIAREAAMQQALEEIRRLWVVKEISSFVRVED